jgi:ribosomal protein L20A (L18A)
MSDKYLKVDTLEELKDMFGSYTKIQWEEFKFEKAGKGMTKEYHVYYKDNKVETFSMDLISKDKLERNIRRIRKIDPESVGEWLNKES